MGLANSPMFDRCKQASETVSVVFFVTVWLWAH